MKRGDGATRKKRKLLSMLAYDPCMSGWVAGWLGGAVLCAKVKG